MSELEDTVWVLCEECNRISDFDKCKNYHNDLICRQCWKEKMEDAISNEEEERKK